MALTKVGPAGIGSTPGTGYVIGDSFLHSTGLNATNAYYTGIVTAQTFRVLGNFQVDGTTTTLDTEVTSVDKLEVAANNTTVGVAITQSGSGDILNLYDGSSEVFSVADGGAVTATGDISVGGDLTLPDSIIHAGDTNTKIRFPADDTVTVETAGTERLRITSTGRIEQKSNNEDINMDASASGQLKLDGSGYNAALALNAQGLNIYNNSANRGIIFGTNETERLRITSDGKVGINTSTPRALVDFGPGTGNGTLNQTVANYQAVFEAPTGTGNYTRNIAFASRTSAISAAINAVDEGGSDATGLIVATGTAGAIAERLRITSAGSVGIGTDNPNRLLQVYGESGGNGQVLISTAGAFSGTDTADLSFRVYANPSNGNAHNPQAQIQAVGTGSYDAALLFKTAVGGSDNNTPTERLRITSAGMVGINTTAQQISSAERLSVYQGITVLRYDGTNSGPLYLRNGNFTNTTNPYVVFQDTSGNRGAIGIANNESAMYIHGQNGIRFRYGGSQPGTTEAMRITSVGLVGIGTDNPSEKLHVSALGASDEPTIKISSENSSIFLRTAGSGGVFPTGGGGNDGELIYLGGDFRFGIGTASKNLIFFNGSGYTERLRIDSSGRLLLGTTTEGEANADDLTVATSGHTGMTIRSGTANRGNIYFSDGTSGDAEYRGYITYDHDGDKLKLGTANADRLLITSGGDVGIGEDSPADRLVVQETNASGDVGIRVKNDTLTDGSASTPTTASLYLNTSTGDFNTFYIQARRYDNDTHFGYADPRSNGHTPNMVLTNEGNVTIGGKSNPNWASTVDALTIGYAGVLYEDSYTSGNDNYIILGNNTFYNASSAGNTYIRNDQAQRIMMQGGAWWFQSAGTGTAGNAITFADRLRITNDGKVGINMSTPTFELDVNGRFRATHGSSGLFFEEVNNGAFLWLDGSNGDFSGGDYYGIAANNSAELQFGYAGASHLVLDSAGKMKLKATGGSGVIADFQEGTSATDSEALISVTTGYSSGSNEGSVRFGSKRTGNGNAGHFMVSTRQAGSNISSGWFNRFYIKDNSQFQYNSYRAHKYSNEGASTSLYKFRLGINMIGNVTYTIRLRGFSNGAHHVRLMASHWSGGYQLVKESYYFTSTTTGLSEDSRVNVSSSYQGAWSVSRPTNGQTGYTTDLIISKSSGSYHGAMVGMIEITTPNDLYLVSIT